MCATFCYLMLLLNSLPCGLGLIWLSGGWDEPLAVSTLTQVGSSGNAGTSGQTGLSHWAKGNPIHGTLARHRDEMPSPSLSSPMLSKAPSQHSLQLLEKAAQDIRQKQKEHAAVSLTPRERIELSQSLDSLGSQKFNFFQVSFPVDATGTGEPIPEERYRAQAIHPTWSDIEGWLYVLGLALGVPALGLGYSYHRLRRWRA